MSGLSLKGPRSTKWLSRRQALGLATTHCSWAMCCVLNRRCVTPWLHWMLPKQVSRMVYQPCRMPAPDCTEYHLLTQTTVQSVVEVRCHSIWLEIPLIIPIPSLMALKPTNYHPISLPSIVSKIVERHVYSLVIEHLLCHHPLSACPWGF